METVKCYQINPKTGLETFAVRLNSDNVSESLALCLFDFANASKQWNAKGKRFSRFSLGKDLFFAASNGQKWSANVQKLTGIKFKYHKNLTLADYRELAADIIWLQTRLNIVE